MANTQLMSLQVGQEISDRPYVISLERMLAFSGGPLATPGWPARNLHTDADKAAEAGLDAPIASGIQYEGHLIKLLLGIFGDAWFREGTLTVKYVRPVRAGDTVRSRVKVTALEGGVCTMEIHCEKADGEPALVGTATCPVRS